MKLTLALFAVLFLTACDTYNVYNPAPAEPVYRATCRTFQPYKIIPAPGCASCSVYVEPIEGYELGKLDVRFLVDIFNTTDYQVYVVLDNATGSGCDEYLIVERPWMDDPWTTVWYKSFCLYGKPATGFWIQLRWVNLFEDEPGIWSGFELMVEYNPEDSTRMRP